MLPSGQFVTRSELTAALIADLETDRSIMAPGWVGALHWLAPAILAILAVLFLPERDRRSIGVICVVAVVALLLVEMLLLYVLRVRLDIGRAALIFVGVGLLSLWLVGNPRKATQDAFKRGSDFLAARAGSSRHLPSSGAARPPTHWQRSCTSCRLHSRSRRNRNAPRRYSSG